MAGKMKNESRVPSYTFSTVLAEQEAQLAENPCPKTSRIHLNVRSARDEKQADSKKRSPCSDKNGGGGPGSPGRASGRASRPMDHGREAGTEAG